MTSKLTKKYEFPTLKLKLKSRKDYCPLCHKRTQHVKVGDFKLCKTCGYQERMVKY